MKKIMQYHIGVILLLLICCYADAQVKKTPGKNNASMQKKTKSLSPAPEGYIYTGTTEDSIKLAQADSMNWAKDSVRIAREDSIIRIKYSLENETATKEWSRIYRENWYPRDSLSYVDDIVQPPITKNEGVDVDGAVAIIKKQFTSSLQMARAFFYWIAATVKYDDESFAGNRVLPIYNNDSDAYYTFKDRKGVCQNYANLYKYMCNQAGIECKYVTGLGKNFPYCINPEEEESNHAWNVVKANKGWILIDVTWATIDTPDVDPYWFNTPPGQFIFSHFPGDSTLQFLTKKIAKKTFLNFPIVSKFLFRSKLDFEVPAYKAFRLASNKFSISVPEQQKDFTIGYSLMPYKGDDWRPYMPDRETKEVETKAVIDRKSKIIDYEVEIPSKGIWWLSVNLNKKIKNKYLSEVSFPEVILFKITY